MQSEPRDGSVIRKAPDREGYRNRGAGNNDGGYPEDQGHCAQERHEPFEGEGAFG